MQLYLGQLIHISTTINKEPTHIITWEQILRSYQESIRMVGFPFTAELTFIFCQFKLIHCSKGKIHKLSIKSCSTEFPSSKCENCQGLLLMYNYFNDPKINSNSGDVIVCVSNLCLIYPKLFLVRVLCCIQHDTSFF